MTFVLDDVLRGTNGTWIGGEISRFPCVSTDTRKLAPGALFWAIAGENHDGHDFVRAAFAAGAGGAVVRRGFVLSPDDWPDERAALIAVTDTVAALGSFAAYWRNRQGAPVVAITGSNGKTTTKELTAAVLRTRGPVLATEGNFNNQIGLPLTLLRWRDEPVAVVELGMSAPGEIRALARIARPQVGVITQIAAAHLEGLGTIEAVASAKWELAEELDAGATAVLNLDDPHLAARLPTLRCRARTYGIASAADVRAERVEERGAEGMRFEAVTSQGERASVRLRLVGRHNVSNALAALAVGLERGVTLAAGAEALARVEPVKGRMRPVACGRDVVLIDDTYNANPGSLEAALAAAHASASGRRVIAVLGEMRELGPGSEALHRDGGERAAALGFDAVVGVGAVGELYVAGAGRSGRTRAVAVSDADAAVAAVLSELSGPTLLLVKGSRGARMERVVDGLVRALGPAEAHAEAPSPAPPRPAPSGTGSSSTEPSSAGSSRSG